MTIDEFGKSKKMKVLEKIITSTNDALNIIDLPVDLVEDVSRAENKCTQGITKMMNSFTAMT